MTTALLRFELAVARTGRTVPFFAAGFAVASLAVAFVGLSAGGVVAVQGFARTSVSLLQLIIWTVPLVALLTGAVAGAECHELEFVFALPVGRGRLLVARWAALLVALGAALLIGLGGAGVVIGTLAGAADGLRYLTLTGVSTLLLAACLAIGLAIGVLARTRARALALAIGAWFLCVVGVDLVAIALLAILPAGNASWGLAVLLVANPVGAARVLGLGLFSADVLAGPTGAALRAVLGGWGAWVLTGALAAWTAAPLWVAARALARQDL